MDCRDKFTCLPRAIEEGLTKLRVKADLEVDAVLEGRITYADAVARMKRRMAKRSAGAPLLPEDLPTWPMLDDADAPPVPAPPPLPVQEEIAVAVVDAAPPALASADDEPQQTPGEEEEDDVATTKSKKFPEGVRVSGGVVYRDGARLGTVRKAKQGWGWFTAGTESASWFADEASAVTDLLRVRSSKAARKAAKPEPD